jgi:hypothetical protein
LKRPDYCGGAVTAAYTKCSWTRNRLNKQRDGSKNIANSGKVRWIGSLLIWKRQTGQERREPENNYVPDVHRKPGVARGRRELRQWIHGIRHPKIFEEKTNKQEKTK